MHETIELAGKPLEVHLTSRAGEALDRRVTPLVVEMRVQFGCLITKQIVFTDDWLDAEADWLTPMLGVRFRTLVMKTCSAEDLSAGVPLEDFRVGGKGRISPRWLQLDYQAGGWVGEFGLVALRR